MINLILSIPAADDPSQVQAVFDGEWVDGEWIAGAGFKTEIPPRGVMPSSLQAASRHLVNCVVCATYQQIKDVTRPGWQIFGAQGLLTGEVHKALNSSVWNFLPDRLTGQQTELHMFQGSVKWPSR